MSFAKLKWFSVCRKKINLIIDYYRFHRLVVAAFSGLLMKPHEMTPERIAWFIKEWKKQKYCRRETKLHTLHATIPNPCNDALFV